MNRNVEKLCLCCGAVKNYTGFNKISFLKDATHLKYCKSCCNKLFKIYRDSTKSDYAALWCLVIDLGIPFKREAWDFVKEVVIQSSGLNQPIDLFSAYLRAMTSLGQKFNGIWESDIMLTDLYRPNPNAYKEEDARPVDYEEQIKIWGRYEKEGHKGNKEIDKEAYDYFNYSFENYTKDLGDMDTNLVNRYRDLVKAEWRLRKANESGEGSEISKAQDSLTKMLSLLKLNNFKDTNVSNEQRAFERQISMIEDYEPAECEELNKYLDMVGYEKDKALLMRSLRNAICNTREYPDISPEEAE